MPHTLTMFIFEIVVYDITVLCVNYRQRENNENYLVNNRIYKSLFTEHTVASKKHSSTIINTNKAKTTTKSITVVDTWYWSINKISYIINAVHQI